MTKAAARKKTNETAGAAPVPLAVASAHDEPAKVVRVDTDLLRQAEEMSRLPRAAMMRLRVSQLISAAARLGMDRLRAQLGEPGEVASRIDVDDLLRQHAAYLNEWRKVADEMTGATAQDVSLEVARRRVLRGLPGNVDLSPLRLDAAVLTSQHSLTFVD